MRQYPDRPWVAVGVVVHKDDKVLLIRRGKEPNKGSWSLPGGAQDIGETVFEAAYREVLEETGLHTKDPALIDVIDSLIKDPQGRIEYHYTLIEVGCRLDHGKLLPQSDAMDAQWVNIKDLEKYKMPDITLTVIRKSYLSRKDSLTEA